MISVLEKKPAEDDIIELDLNKPWPKKSRASTWMDEAQKDFSKPSRRKSNQDFITVVQ